MEEDKVITETQLDVPTKPLNDSPVVHTIYHTDCEDYILNHATDQQIQTFIQHLNVELTMRNIRMERRRLYHNAFHMEQIKFLEDRKNTMDKLKNELDEAQINLRKKYIKSKNYAYSSDDEEEEEEDDEANIPKYKKKVVKKVAKKKS
jgi:hypothetical protein